MGLDIDKEDIDFCEDHQCNFVIGDECHICKEDKSTKKEPPKSTKTQSFLSRSEGCGGCGYHECEC